MDALEIKGLRKEYPGFCLDGLDLELPQGCIMGLIGENGAGKSTAIKSVLRLIRPDAGEIRVFGRPVSESTADDVGFVLDEGCFPAKMSCEKLGQIMKRFYRAWDAAGYRELLRRFGLPEGKSFGELSRGMRMKLSLAVAMSHGARLLVLDEATAGLDVVARDELLDILLDYISDGERSILISSHIVSDLEKICDYICFIHRGRRLFLDEKDVLLDKYCVVHCSRAELERIPREDVIGCRTSEYGAEALMERGRAPRGLITERAGLEDIIVYHIRGEEK